MNTNIHEGPRAHSALNLTRGITFGDPNPRLKTSGRRPSGGFPCRIHLALNRYSVVERKVAPGRKTAEGKEG